jgi:phosphatidate cytidylyltransferase
MLKLRIITALILGPFILWSVLTFSHRAIAIELAIIFLLGAWEWARMSGLNSQYARIFYALSIGLLMTLASLLLHIYPEHLSTAIYFVVGWWFFCLFWLVHAEKTGLNSEQPFTAALKFTNLMVGIVVLLGAFIALTGLHQAESYGAYYIIALLILIWTADTAAYFTGKALGKHKLAPNISPGKTWEGVAGAMLGIILVAYLLTIFLELSGKNVVSFIILSVIAIVFSIAGDLFESMFKRRAGIKDSSQILPGHGGILDRIDSLLSASPIFFSGLLLAGIK